MIKKILIPGFLGFVLLVLLFWKPLGGYLLETCVQSYCRGRFGEGIETEKVYREHGFWVFEKPVLRHSGTNLAADRLLLSVGLRPFERTVELDLIIENSRITLMEEAANLETVIKDLLAHSIPYWLFKIHTNFVIKEGKVLWDESGGSTNEADFRFFADSCGPCKQACLALFLDGKGQSTNFFEFLIGQEDGQPLAALLNFRNVDCKKIGKIAHVFTGSGPGWEFDSGNLDGKIHLRQPEHKRGSLWGEAVLHDCSFHHENLEIAGSLKRGRVQLESQIGKKEVPRIMGSIALEREASLTLSKGGIPQWKIEGVTGKIAFLPGEGVVVDFAGNCTVEKHRFGMSLTGDASVFDETQAAIDLTCKLFGPNKEESAIHLSARQLGTLYNSAEIAFANFGKDEFNLFHTLASRKIPQLEGLRMRGGSCDASGIAYLQEFRISDLQIEKIEGKNLFFDYEPLGCALGIEAVSGDLALQLNVADPLNTLEANFSLSDCKASFQGFDGNLWINTNLAVRKGILQKSEMTGEFAGLKGSLIVDWGSAVEFLRVNLAGPSANLASFMPEAVSAGFERAFNDGMINITGGMAWIPSGARFSGELLSSGQKIAVGFDMQKSSEKLWKRWPADGLAVSYWENAGLEAMRTVMPPITSPAVLLESNWIRSESGIAGMVIRKGWFRAERLPLEKYISPFVFPNREVSLSGSTDVSGLFDHKSVSVEYTAENVLLENNYLAIAADKIGSAEKHIYGFHSFDFVTKAQYGTLPLSHARYTEKNTGLIFTDAEAGVYFDGSHARLSDVSLQCGGIFLAGKIGIEFGIPNDREFAIDVHVDRAKGTLSDCLKIVSLANPEFPTVSFPIDGNVSLRKEGADLSFLFLPDEVRFEGGGEGTIAEGHASFEGLGLGIRDVKCDFYYDHGKQALAITHISGGVAVGNGPGSEEYFLSGEYLNFLDFSTQQMEMDLWIGDKNRDIVRVVGKTSPADPSFHLDLEKTHFGDAHPKNFQLVLKDWTTLEKFHLNVEFSLNTLAADLQKVIKPGFFKMSPAIVRGLKNIRPSNGTLMLDLSYRGEEQEFIADVSASGLALGEASFDRCALKLRKSGDFYCLDSLLLDEYLLSGYFRSKEDSWSISQLTFRRGEAFSLKMDGDYFPAENALESNLSSLYLDLDSLSGSSEAIDAFLDACPMQGKMTANGKLRLGFSQGVKAEAILDASLKNWGIKGLFFQDVQHVSCHFVSDKGLTFRNLSAGILSPGSYAAHGQICVEKAAYEFLNGEIVLENLDFRVPAHHLPWFSEALSRSFPDFVTPATAEVLRNMKLQGFLEGTLQYEYSPPYTAMRLELKDGNYLFLNTEHDLKNFVLEYDPFEFKVTSRYTVGEESIWMYGRSTSPGLSYGEVVLTDAAPEGRGRIGFDRALFLLWENEPAFGFSIKSAEGTFSGLDFHLQRDTAEPSSLKSLYLVGKVGIDIQKAKALLPSEIAAQAAAWRAGAGYSLQGKWRVQKSGSIDYADKLHFIGTLEGTDFSFNGLRFDAMAAHLEYTPRSVRLQDFRITDASGIFFSERIDLAAGADGRWNFTIPSLRVEKFRPSLLCEEGKLRPHSRKPLVVREMVLQDCKGSFSDSHSITGLGSLRFSNRSQKVLQHPLFQIPADLLSRIGLDPAVLTPVTGTIDYRFQDGKIILTKIKDAYSDSKLSKFFLSGGPPSTMDFDGNLSLHVRMKQNNLLFKLAELFTVNIGGTLQKPTYSLSKQGKEE